MKKILPIIIAIIVAGGLGFYIGTKSTGGGNTPADNNKQIGSQNFQPGSGFGAGRRAGVGTGGGFVSGDVIKKDATSITVQTNEGSSKVILISDTTPVMKEASGTLGDVLVGKQITVIGSANSDGSITAQSIQLRPNLRNN
ncbi:MAG: hypothetical protein WCX12_02055 [Candidatus Paceibacterota bacterium]|jgi:hypothetical protein